MNKMNLDCMNRQHKELNSSKLKLLVKKTFSVFAV